METTEAPSRQAGRPRSWMVFALVAVLVVFLGSKFWPLSPATGPAGPSNTRTPAGAGQEVAKIKPGDLDVRLEALNPPSTEADDEGGRNPFRFYVKPPPEPPPPPPTRDRPEVEVDPGPPPPPPAPVVPPITLKFIGIVEPKPGDRVAAFSDCRITTHAREGDAVLGQYRLVRLGLESVVMEYLDGRGRTTIRLSGQECVGK